jgi:hypothetical protein
LTNAQEIPRIAAPIGTIEILELMAMINVEVLRTIRRPVAVVSRQFGKGLEEGRLDLEQRGYGKAGQT